MATSREHIPFHKTTPEMAGKEIRDMQDVLVKHGYLKGKADGIYGPITGQAVFREKYWRQGRVKPDQVAGQEFLDILYGRKKLTYAQKVLVAKRKRADEAKKKKAGQMTHGEAVALRLLSQLGQTENPPNSNRSKFSLWYGMIGAWCAMFGSWGWSVYNKNFRPMHFVAYCPDLFHAASLGINGCSLTKSPVTGNAILYDWPGESPGLADHYGTYVMADFLIKHAPEAYRKAIREFGNLGVGDFWSIEGNTAVGNDSNGGIVMLRKRNIRNVQAFVHISG